MDETYNSTPAILEDSTASAEASAAEPAVTQPISNASHAGDATPADWAQLLNLNPHFCSDLLDSSSKPAAPTDAASIPVVESKEDPDYTVETRKRRADKEPKKQGGDDHKRRKWRKYGQKIVRGKEAVGMDMIRCYFRCNYPGCQVKKKVEKLTSQSNKEANVTVTGLHTHPYSYDEESEESEEDTPATATSAPKANKSRDPIPIPPVNNVLIDCVKYASQHCVVSDPSQVDCPIVFASPGFYQLTGYSPDEVLGRNCRFLQGKDTNPNAIKQISKACRLEKDIRLFLLNYKKDGTPFWNLLHLTAVKDAQGKLVSYVGNQMDVSEHVPVLKENLNSKELLNGEPLPSDLWDWDLAGITAGGTLPATITDAGGNRLSLPQTMDTTASSCYAFA